jgi:hypothetical protein
MEAFIDSRWSRLRLRFQGRLRFAKSLAMKGVVGYRGDSIRASAVGFHAEKVAGRPSSRTALYPALNSPTWQEVSFDSRRK